MTRPSATRVRVSTSDGGTSLFPLRKRATCVCRRSSSMPTSWQLQRDQLVRPQAEATAIFFVFVFHQPGVDIVGRPSRTAANIHGWLREWSEAHIVPGVGGTSHSGVHSRLESTDTKGGRRANYLPPAVKRAAAHAESAADVLGGQEGCFRDIDHDWLQC